MLILPSFDPVHADTSHSAVVRLQTAAEAVKQRRGGRRPPATSASQPEQKQTPGMPSKGKAAAAGGSSKAGRAAGRGSADALAAVKQESQGPAVARRDEGAPHAELATAGADHDAGAAADGGSTAAGKGKTAAKSKRGAPKAKGRRTGAAALASVPEGKPSTDGPAGSAPQAERTMEVKAEPPSSGRALLAADGHVPQEAPSAAASTKAEPRELVKTGTTAEASQRVSGRRKGMPPATDGTEAQPSSGAASTAAIANGGRPRPALL